VGVARLVRGRASDVLAPARPEIRPLCERAVLALGAPPWLQDGAGMCNLCSLTHSQDEIRRLTHAIRDTAGNLPTLPGIFPDQLAPVCEWRRTAGASSLERFPFLRNRKPLSFSFICRIFSRRTGVHFAGKCSSGRGGVWGTKGAVEGGR
jgi:hypothetical protein